MIEALATIIILVLMLVPGLNIIVGATTWGFFGALIGCVVTTIFAFLNYTVDKDHKEGLRQVSEMKAAEAREKRLAEIQYNKLLPDDEE